MSLFSRYLHTTVNLLIDKSGQENLTICHRLNECPFTSQENRIFANLSLE
jgi:hypothetical protein